MQGLSEPIGALFALLFVKPFLTPLLLQYMLAFVGGIMVGKGSLDVTASLSCNLFKVVLTSAFFARVASSLLYLSEYYCCCDTHKGGRHVCTLTACITVQISVCGLELWPEARKCGDDWRLGQGVLFGTLIMGWTLYIGI